jgi:hypothetical protein
VPIERLFLARSKYDELGARMGLLLYRVRLAHGDELEAEAVAWAEYRERMAGGPVVPEFDCPLTALEIEAVRVGLVAELLDQGLMGPAITHFQGGPDEWVISFLLHRWAMDDFDLGDQWLSDSALNTWRATQKVRDWCCQVARPA